MCVHVFEWAKEEVKEEKKKGKTHGKIVVYENSISV